MLAVLDLAGAGVPQDPIAERRLSVT